VRKLLPFEIIASLFLLLPARQPPAPKFTQKYWESYGYFSSQISETKGHKKNKQTRYDTLEKRFRNGWIKRQVTLVVSHKARPICVDQP
jgi:hypothetical protein